MVLWFLIRIVCLSHPVSPQEVTGDDDSDLFLAEREQELKKEQEAKRRWQRSVPGVLGPHEMTEEMQDE